VKVEVTFLRATSQFHRSSKKGDGFVFRSKMQQAVKRQKCVQMQVRLNSPIALIHFGDKHEIGF